MKNYLTTLIFSISCSFLLAQYIPEYSYFLADFTSGNTNIYKINFEENTANLTYLTSITTEVHIAYKASENRLYAINKSGSQLRTLDLNSPSPSFSEAVDLNSNLSDITAAAFDDSGTLFVGSANQNKVYRIDIVDFNVELYDDYAPISGGDMAFGLDGGLYLATQTPSGFYEIFPSSIGPDSFIGGIPSKSTGLSAFYDGNFLFSHRGDSYLQTRSSEDASLIFQFDLFLDGEPFTLHWGDLASGYDSEFIPTYVDDCDFKRTVYADYDGVNTRIYSLSFDTTAAMDLITTLNFEAHIGTNTNNLLFAVNSDGSSISLFDLISGAQLGTVPLNLAPAHIVGVVADANMLYMADQNTGNIYVVNSFSTDLDPVLFANGPVSGGDICFYGDVLYLANRSLSKLYKFNGSDFIEMGDIPPNVTGLATFSNYDHTNAGSDMVISCRGSNTFYSISPENGQVLESFEASVSGAPFTFNYGDMASYCEYAQITDEMCTAYDIVEYHPGTTFSGDALLESRTDPYKALNMPEPADDMNFVTLGYGGSIILSMSGYIQNGSGDDLEIFETSFNTEGCSAYPEYADVSLSQDGVNWIFIGTVCKSDNTLDISDATDLDLFPFVKIENNDEMTSTPDGFDLNGVVSLHDCLPIEEEEFKSVSSTDLPEANIIEVSPNPGSTISKLNMVPNMDGILRADIFDLNGRKVITLFNEFAKANEIVETTFSANSIPNGVYVIRMTTENSSKILKFIVAH